MITCKERQGKKTTASSVIPAENAWMDVAYVIGGIMGRKKTSPALTDTPRDDLLLNTTVARVMLR